MLVINSLHLEVSLETVSYFSIYKELDKLYVVICTLFNYGIHSQE